MQQGQLRTKAQEEMIQEGTLEQMEWARITHVHHENEIYARETARRFLGMLEKTRENNGNCECHKNGSLHVLELIADKTWVAQVLEVWGVEWTHLPMATELVRSIGKLRCAERLGIAI